MRRFDFIRLGIGASAVTALASLPGLGSWISNDLERWARRHRATLTTGPAETRLLARPPRAELADALQELNLLADGSLHCAGNEITGSFSGRPFRVTLRATA